MSTLPTARDDGPDPQPTSVDALSRPKDVEVPIDGLIALARQLERGARKLRRIASTAPTTPMPDTVTARASALGRSRALVDGYSEEELRAELARKFADQRAVRAGLDAFREIRTPIDTETP